MRRETLGSRWVATLAVLVGLALAGPVAAAPAGTVTFAIPSEPPTVDPAIEVAGPGYRVLFQLYEGLLEYRGTTTELAPALAQSWRVAPDGTSIELKLRPNVKFHDGSTLDAETVKASIDRTKAVNRGGAFFLHDAQGGPGRRPDDRPPGGHAAVGLAALRAPQGVHHREGAPGRRGSGRGVLRDGRQRDRPVSPDPVGEGPADRPRPLRGLLAGVVGQPCRPGHPARGPGGRHPAAPARARRRAPGGPRLHRHHAGPEGAGGEAGREDGGHSGLPGDRHLDEHAEGPAQGRPPPQGPPGRLRLRGHGAGVQGIRRDPEQPDSQGLHGGIRAEPAAVQARHRPGEAAPRRGRATRASR